MASRTLPNLGLTGFFDLGEDGWGDDMSLNLLLLSTLSQAGAKETVSVDPATPVDGEVYIFAEDHPTQPNKIAIRDAGAWVYATPLEGWRVYDRAAGVLRLFDGTVWTDFTSGSGGGGIEEAPEDGAIYGRRDAEWVEVPGASGGGGIYPPFVPADIDVLADFTSGDTFTGWTIIPQTGMASDIGFHGAELEQIASTQGHCLSVLRPIADFGFGSALVAGDAIVIRLLALGESAYFHVTAPCFTNGVTAGAGTQIVGQTIPFHQSGLGRMCFAAATYNNFTTRTDSAADGFFNLGASAPIWVRLVFLGSNTYRMDISADGVFWLPGNTRVNSLTVSHAGFLFTRINGDGSPGRGKTSIQICGSMQGVT